MIGGGEMRGIPRKVKGRGTEGITEVSAELSNAEQPSSLRD